MLYFTLMFTFREFDNSELVERPTRRTFASVLGGIHYCLVRHLIGSSVTNWKYRLVSSGLIIKIAQLSFSLK